MGRPMRRLFLPIAALALIATDATATVTSSTRTVAYVGSSNTQFTVTFPFLSKSDITVRKTLIATGVDVSPFAQGSQYTVTLPVGSTNGYVTTTSAVTSSYRITITRTVPYTQTVDFSGQGSYSAQRHEDALDKLTMEVQQIIAGSGGVTQSDIDTAIADHEAAADPHPGYFLLAGESGGQHAYGGTAASDTAWITPTSNGTQGLFKVGTTGTELVVDDVNDRVGIGTATPSAELQVVGEVVAVANTANAAGGTFTGAATNADGVVAQGVGTGDGVQGTGGATGPGVNGIGGSASGSGVVGTGTAGNAQGGTFTGQGSGAGAKGTGGGSGGNGLWGIGGSGNGMGVVAGGNGSGTAVYAEADTTGIGIEAFGGATSGNAASLRSDTTTPVSAALHIVPQDTNPSSPVAGDVYFNSVDGSFRYYNGTGWIAGTGNVAGATTSIQSTSNATKGYIALGSSGTELVVDDVNDKVGLGTTSPTSTLEVRGSIAGKNRFINNQAASYNASLNTDCNSVITNNQANAVINLPAITGAAADLGCEITIINSVAGQCIQFNPDASDGIQGTVAAVTVAGAAGIHVANTAATSVKGDYLRIVSNDSTLWYIVGGVGVWKAGACP